MMVKLSSIRDIEIKNSLKSVLRKEINNREAHIKGIDHSYYYEDYATFKLDELQEN